MRGKTQHDEGRRNRPIATLIEWYTDKKSGKVSDARQEIKRRFDGLDWEQQKQIMSLFLDGCKTDRQGALPLGPHKAERKCLAEEPFIQATSI